MIYRLRCLLSSCSLGRDAGWQIFPPLGPLMLLLVISPQVARGERAEAQKAADLLPASTVLYAEINRPGELLDVVLEHPAKARLESLAPYRKALESPGYLRLKAGVSVVEAEMELPWRKIVGALGEGGLYLAFDATTQGTALLMQARDEATLSKARETLLGLARAEAARQGREDPVRSADYRGVTAYRLGDARFATVGRWLLVANKDELGKRLLDASLESSEEVLSSNTRFQQAMASRDPRSAAWLYADMETIRAAMQEQAGDEDALKGPRDNPVAELLLGGVFTALKRAPYATLSLLVESRDVRLVAQTPFDPEWIEESREYYFGAKAAGTAPPLLPVKQPILAVSAYRDVSQMWLRAGDLFNEQVNDGLAQADSNLSTLFSGKDFGEEILGAFGPQLQLLVTRQDFAGQNPQPAIKLPAFAVVARLKDAETMRPELRRTFMSLIGFLNVVGAMNGQPQLDFDMQKGDKGQLVAAEYVVEEKDKESKEAAINYNFSPTIAFRDATFIVSSTRQLAQQLLDVLPAAAAPPIEADQRSNALAKIDFGGVRDILADNKNQLISQNMLEQGHTREEAEGEVGLLLELIGLLRGGDMRLSSGDGRLMFEASLSVAEEQAGGE